MNGYICFYGAKRIEVYAETTYLAQCKAAALLKVKPDKQYQITVKIAERADGSTVTHSTSSL
jgi:hypothetical protein